MSAICPVPYLYLNSNSTIDYVINNIRQFDLTDFGWCSSILTNNQRNKYDNNIIKYFPLHSTLDFTNFLWVCYWLYAIVFYYLAITEMMKRFVRSVNVEHIRISQIITFMALGIVQIVIIYIWSSSISVAMIDYQNITILTHWIFGFFTLCLGLCIYYNNKVITNTIWLLWFVIIQTQQSIDIASNSWIYIEIVSNYLFILYIYVIWQSLTNENIFANQCYFISSNVILCIIGSLPLIMNSEWNDKLLARYTHIIDDSYVRRYQMWTGLGIICFLIGFFIMNMLYQFYIITRQRKNNNINYTELINDNNDRYSDNNSSVEEDNNNKMLPNIIQRKNIIMLGTTHNSNQSIISVN